MGGGSWRLSCSAVKTKADFENTKARAQKASTKARTKAQKVVGHKPTADFEFENTKARAQNLKQARTKTSTDFKASTHKSKHRKHARKHAQKHEQKAQKQKRTRARKHGSIESTKARKHRTQKAQKAQSSTHRERAEKAGYPDGALLVWLLLTVIGWRDGRKISLGSYAGWEGSVHDASATQA